jgi:hypothetical protein
MVPADDWFGREMIGMDGLAIDTLRVIGKVDGLYGLE